MHSESFCYNRREVNEMTKPMIYLQRPFRPEWIEKIQRLAPEYTITTELPTDLSQIEITVGWEKQTELALLKAENLKWVQAISAGVNQLPLPQFAQKDILLSNGSGIHSVSISEHVIGSLLAYYRGLLPAILDQKSHTWNPEAIHYDQLAGKKMLVVGTGHIGQKLAQLAHGLSVQVYGINTTGHPVAGFEETYAIKNLAKIVPEMDIVVDILPSTEATYHLFNSTVFHAMKPSAVFVNVGRGDTVHTKELITALNEQQFAYAMLDVFEEEPLNEDSPLWKLKNVLLTPHISGLTVDFERKFMTIFLANLKSYLADHTLSQNQIDLKRGY